MTAITGSLSGKLEAVVAAANRAWTAAQLPQPPHYWSLLFLARLPAGEDDAAGISEAIALTGGDR